MAGTCSICVAVIALAAFARGALAGVLPEGGPFIYATFFSEDESLRIYQSSDGISWSAMKNGPVFSPQSGLRDPSIFRDRDGRFLLAYTPARGCASAPVTAGLAMSRDMENWNALPDIPMPENTVKAVAPEWFSDVDGSVHLFVSVSTDAAQKSYGIWETHPLSGDFSAWSEPANVLPPDGGIYIDPFVVFRPPYYYLWYRRMASGGIADGIGYSTSTSLTGNYQSVKTEDWAGFGADKEGETLIPCNAGVWRIYYDNPIACRDTNGISYSDSSDGFQTWSLPEHIRSGRKLRHGTVMALKGWRGRDLMETVISRSGLGLNYLRFAEEHFKAGIGLSHADTLYGARVLLRAVLLPHGSLTPELTVGAGVYSESGGSGAEVCAALAVRWHVTRRFSVAAGIGDMRGNASRTYNRRFGLEISAGISF